MTDKPAPQATTPPAQQAPAKPLTEEEQAKKKRKEEAKKVAKAAKQAKFDAKKAMQKEAKEKAASAPSKKEKEKKEEGEGEKEDDAPWENKTPPGEKKLMESEMASAYHPQRVEAAWYEWWEKSGFFKPETCTGGESAEKFVIVIPPPNVTGSLHLGHALTNSIQDTLVRWHRMLGHRTLWVPGTDHAGIATQVVVEKKIARERGITRHDLGRERFVEEVWQWKNLYGRNIVRQLRRIGSSVDWSRETFTMDAIRSNSVTEAFVRLHDMGLIYRDNRLVNWDCTLRTAISDIEVEYIDITEPTRMRVPGHGDKTYPFGELVHFAYKVDGGKDDEEIVCATTRIETMLADTAVAIHPDDARYKHLHGRRVVHPFRGCTIPIICDGKLVDPAFGTGCVKVTPAHDPNDYDSGQRNGLEVINMLNDDGTLNAACGEFAGMKRFDARLAVLEAIKKRGLYRKTTANVMRVGVCSRSKDIIEPRLVPQWYVDCKKAAADSVAAVREGRIQIVPRNFEADWYRWLENIRDWCISRQLWWGHRIPAYLCTVRGRPAPDPHKNEDWVTGRTAEEAAEKAARKYGCAPADIIKLEQDPDVLDTWFSSGLFPFSVFGWPEKTADLERYFPGTLLETGYDILFFWVARMVMMSLMLTGKPPFTHVMLHAMVRDAHGRKMSKTLGNVIDPIDVIEGIALEALHEKLTHGNLRADEVERAKAGQKADFPNGIAECGTDAMRFALCAYTSQGRDINLDINRVVGYRNFCNKLWNALRFSLSKLGTSFVPLPEGTPLPLAPSPSMSPSAMDRWILSRLSAAVRDVNRGFEEYDLSAATSVIYNFWLYDLCDVYLESCKPIFSQSSSPSSSATATGATEATKAACRETLFTCVETGLRMLHPFMPFVTEELWQRLPKRPRASQPSPPQQPEASSIMLAPYPIPAAGYGALAAPELEADFASVMEVVRAVRHVNAPYAQEIKKSGKKPRVHLRIRNPKLAALLGPSSPFADPARALCLAIDGPLRILDAGAPAPPGCAIELVGNDCEVLCELRGIVDVDAELAKIEKRQQKIASEIEAIRAKLADPLFEKKTPIEVRDATRAKVASLEEELRIAKGTAATLAGMKSS